MSRLRLPVLLLAAFLFSAIASFAAPPSGDFEGLWLGEIVAPNARTQIGLAFTPTEKGLLVSLHLPAMFLYGVNFGPAEIHDGVFTLDALNLAVTQHGDTLVGTFAPAGLPVELHRGGSFTAEPPAPVFPAPPAPAWSHSLGAPAWASPVTRDGVIYVGTIDGKFHAIRATDGSELWTWTGENPLYGEALASDDSLFFVDERSDLVSLARVDGTLRWRLALHDEKTAGGPAPKNETFNHRTATPVIDTKGILYIGSTDGGVYAVRAKTGKKLWRHDAKAKIYAPVTFRGDDLIVGCFDGSVITYNRRTRQETSRVKLGGPIVSAPVIAGDRIVVGARDYLLYGLDSSKSAAIAWRNSYWFSWVESTPRLVDGLLYIGGSDYRRVSAIEPATGRVRWATDVLGLTWGSPVISADTVYAATAGQNIDGTVIKHSGGIVALDRQTGAVKWRYVSPTPATAGFTGYTNSLTLAGGKIIGASVDGTLVAFPISLSSP